ncbi:MAG: hypothetical protein CSA23_04970 [Deltaproteobacteria bacterium]|nr:MAG: hypothetical protein CSA23_04970 [Deltaproteobacteria bacterium]
MNWLQWLKDHPSTPVILDLCSVLWKDHAILCTLVLPFVWPPVRWLLKQYTKLTPWKDDDDFAEKINQQINKKIGLANVRKAQ